MDEEERRRACALSQAGMLFGLFASLTPGDLDPKARTGARDRAFARLQQSYNLEFPWLVDENKSARAAPGATDVQALVDAWKAAWGDPDDPVVAQKIQNTYNALMRPVRRLQQQRGSR